MYRDMTRGGITRSLLLFALPMMVGSLLQQLYNVADTLSSWGVRWAATPWQRWAPPSR